jgi:antitoxin VapB
MRCNFTASMKQFSYQLVADPFAFCAKGWDSTNPRREPPALTHAYQAALPMIYTIDIYFLGEVPMPKTDIAKLFQNGRSQAVRLPKEFRFEGDRVRIRRVAQGVLLEPLIPNTAQWFEELDQFNPEPFLARGRRQPVTPKRKIF